MPSVESLQFPHPFLLPFNTIDDDDDDGGFHGRVAALELYDEALIMKLEQPRPRNLRRRALLVAGLCATGGAGQSTVSVYLPGYSDADWAALRGSIVHSVCWLFLLCLTMTMTILMLELRFVIDVFRTDSHHRTKPRRPTPYSVASNRPHAGSPVIYPLCSQQGKRR